jgi:hypothetical protein
MSPVLDLAQRYYPDSFPGVIAEFRERTPRWLRRATRHMTLTGLSWSNLRIAAFPGIQWARSPGEALRFMRSRVFPEPVALDELEFARQSQPALMQLPWYGIPHAQRMLRWAFTRAPRVQTVMSVQAALADAHESP